MIEHYANICDLAVFTLQHEETGRGVASDIQRLGSEVSQGRIAPPILDLRKLTTLQACEIEAIADVQANAPGGVFCGGLGDRRYASTPYRLGVGSASAHIQYATGVAGPRPACGS